MQCSYSGLQHCRMSVRVLTSINYRSHCIDVRSMGRLLFYRDQYRPSSALSAWGCRVTGPEHDSQRPGNSSIQSLFSDQLICAKLKH